MTGGGEKKPSRGILFFVWWVAFTTVSMWLNWFSPLVASDFPDWGLILIYIFYVIQTALYWRTLKYFFPAEGRRNVKAALLMLLSVIIGTGLFSFIMAMLTAAAAGD